MVAPGRYSVRIAKRIDGDLTDIGQSETFETVPLGIASLPEPDRAEVLAFQKKTGDLQRAVMGANAAAREAADHFVYIKKALSDTPGADEALTGRARELEIRLMDIREALTGDRTIESRDEPTPPSIMDRVQTIIRGHWYATYGPTRTHRRNYEIAAEEFAVVLEKLRTLIEKDLRELEEAMEAAGAPWTPGRGVPKWKQD